MNRKALIVLNKSFFFFAVLVLSSLLTEQPVSAADIISDNPSETEADKVSPSEDEQAVDDTFIDTWHHALSGTITGSSDWIDSFFYDERYEAEENQSRLLLRLESFSEDGEGTDLKLKANLRVGIPYAQKRLKLILAGEPADEPDIEDATGSTVRRSFDRIEKNDVSVSLQHAIVQKFNRYISTRLGFVFRNWEPRLFLEGRYRTSFDLDPWGVRFTERLRWYTYKGWESNANLDVERLLSARFFFRTTVEVNWLEETAGFSHGLTFSLSQVLSQRRAVEYSLGSSLQTSPNYYLEEVAFRIRYRQRIWRDWLFYDIEPHLRFPNAEGFKMVPGILLRLEAIIGTYKRL